MRYPEIERIVLDAVELLVAAGVSRGAAEKGAGAMEDVAILDLVETDADKRLLDLFDNYGSAKLAERKGVCQKTITNRRNDAAERLARKKIGNEGSARLVA